MSDRELLEAAARAAGYTSLGYAELSGGGPCLIIKDAGMWAPLDDDGDALRLTVQLRLVVDVGSQGTHVFHEGPGCVEAHGADPCAAARRAIVRAAAAMAPTPTEDAR